MSKSRRTSGAGDLNTLASSVLITNVRANKDGSSSALDTSRRRDSLTPKSTRAGGAPVSRTGSRTSLLGNPDNKSSARKPKSATPSNINGRRSSKTKATEITNFDISDKNYSSLSLQSQNKTPTAKSNIPQIVCDEFDAGPRSSAVTKSNNHTPAIIPSFNKEDIDRDNNLLIVNNLSDDSASSDSFENLSINDDVTRGVDSRYSHHRTSSAKSTKRQIISSSSSQLQHMKSEWNKYGQPRTGNFLNDELFDFKAGGRFDRSTTPSSISSIGNASRVGVPQPVVAPSKPRVNATALEEVDDDYFDSDEEGKPTKKKASEEDIKTVYERACRLVGVVPSKRIEREFLGDRVYLDYAGLITAEIKAICIALLNNTTVTRLDLSGNDLCEQAAQYISELINENVFITNLFCATCQLRAHAVSNIIASVTSSKHMVVLDLSENKIQDEEVERVAALIQKNKVLRELRLRYCDIDEEGGKILAKVLADSNLEKLDLSWNQLRQKGGAAFCLALGDNTSIRELDLSWNGLGREGCAALEISLGKNKCLVQLDLTCNRVCTACLGHLLKGIESNRTLESLKLTKNLISMDDALLIATTLLSLNKTSVKVVDISDVTVDNHFVELHEQLQTKKQISVYFGGFLNRPNAKMEQKDRTLASYDPILVLFEYMKQQNLRLIDLFRALDVNHDNAISKQELRNGFLSLNMDLPEGVLCAAFDKLDLNSNNVIDIDELKNAHRRVHRQTTAMMARTQCDDPDDGYGDMLHEFQRLVKAAARARKTPKPRNEDGDDLVGDLGGHREAGSRTRLLSPRPRSRQSLAGVTNSLLDTRRSSGSPSNSRSNSPGRPRSPSTATSHNQQLPGPPPPSRQHPIRRQSSISPSPRNSPRSARSSISPSDSRLKIPSKS